MKYLGIDYGKKNVGLAISDSAGQVAMPFGILENNSEFYTKIAQLLEKEKIARVVIGLSLNLDGQENPLAQEVNKLTGFIQRQNKSIMVYLQDERFSSMAAKWGTEKEIRRSSKKNRSTKKQNKIDDKAASLILQTFLEQRVLED